MSCLTFHIVFKQERQEGRKEENGGPTDLEEENTINTQNIYLPTVTSVNFPAGSRAVSFNITDSVMSSEFQKSLQFMLYLCFVIWFIHVDTES